ncbi:addiction module antidote protein [Martelella soudanensis]|uniref:addiction module antidote protein n=1 Tax=unclassified Martelella TaxID=2629616 RepID=UPI0015DED6B3|nr:MULTISPECIES: addiction module antidote protein [unclassified Martelella]
MTEIGKHAELTPFDAAGYLETPEDIAFYLEAVLEDGDPALIAAALGDVARSKGMSAVSRRAGVTREALYKALSENGDPKLSTLIGVLKALGLQLAVRPENHHDDAA